MGFRSAKQPGWITKVNYVMDFWSEPCHAPVLVYLELALPALGEAILTWFDFSEADVLRGYARPSRALSAGRRSRRGKRRIRYIRFFRALGFLRAGFRRVPGLGDDVGGWIGRNMPGAKQFKGRSISQGAKYLWIIDDIGQRVLFWFLVVDIGITFAYEWATALKESEFCKQQLIWTFYNTGNGVAISPHTGWGSTGAPFQQWEEGPVDFGFTGGFVFSGTGMIISAYVVENKGPNPFTHEQRIVINYSGGQQIIESGQVAVAVDGQAETLVVAQIKGPVGFSIEQRVIGGTAFGVSQDVWGTGQNLIPVA